MKPSSRARFLLTAALVFALGPAGCTSRGGPFELARAREIWPAMNVKPVPNSGAAAARDFEGEDGGKKMKLTVYDRIAADKARRILDLETSRLKDLYRTDILPYHGAVSRRSGCENGDRPRFDTGPGPGPDPDRVRIELAVNERLVPGSCDPARIFYRASFHFLHCAQERRLYLLQVYVPKDRATGPAPEAGVLKCGS